MQRATGRAEKRQRLTRTRLSRWHSKKMTAAQPWQQEWQSPPLSEKPLGAKLRDQSSATQREDDGSAALATRTSKAPPLSEKPLGAKLRDQAPRPSSATKLEEDGSAALAATQAPRPNSRNSQHVI